VSHYLRVNPITCEAHGMCAELLAELVALDPWGYPILKPGPVPRQLVPHARRAVASCPTLALIIDQRSRARSE
jgi:ferredoxin